jgi:hypothetical protein
VAVQRRHQVTDIEPAPAPTVTDYAAQAKQCQSSLSDPVSQIHWHNGKASAVAAGSAAKNAPGPAESHR